MSDLVGGRAVAMLVREARGRAARVEEGPYGAFAVLDSEYPFSYNSNKVVLTGPIPAAAALAFAEQALGSRGLGHRLVWAVDGPTGQRLAPAFAAAGYTVTPLLVMAWEGGAPVVPAEVEVAEVTEAELRELQVASWRAEAPDMPDPVVRQLVDRRETYERPGPITRLAGLVDGRPAARLDLRVRGRVAEIDEVGTLPEFRGRGLAKAMVLEAVQRALADGADVVFLQAAADDWPQELYAKLGFRTVTTGYEFSSVP